MKKLLSLSIAMMLFLSVPVFAQFELGASYQLRDEDPQSGFGVQIQKGFLDQLPLLRLGMRAHFSYFSEDNNVSEGGITYSEDLTNYDFGVDVIAGVNIGLIEPYVGLGLGSTTLDIERSDFPNTIPAGVEQEENESNIYWNMSVGSKVSILPLVKPFVEYRYSNASLSEPEVAELTTGRIIFGVVLSF